MWSVGAVSLSVTSVPISGTVPLSLWTQNVSPVAGRNSCTFV